MVHLNLIRILLENVKIFLSYIVLKFDSVLIVSHINMHLFFDSSPLAQDLLKNIDYFSLTQLVTQPTHKKRHILDLVFSLRLDICTNNGGVGDHCRVDKQQLQGEWWRRCVGFVSPGESGAEADRGGIQTRATVARAWKVESTRRKSGTGHAKEWNYLAPASSNHSPFYQWWLIEHTCSSCQSYPVENR